MENRFMWKITESLELKLFLEKHTTLSNVQYAPKLSFNILSEGQLMTIGHKILFDDGVCTITNKKIDEVLCIINMPCNNTFALDVAGTNAIGFLTISNETFI
ncbi:hypothetical protein HanIR_Chr14g0689321 [Helianthus annuus]|nr:hypothetical protein HanIR_Chr14g0689321 [Helianthus annuus]